MNSQNARFVPGCRSLSRFFATGVMVGLTLCASLPANAAFHLWSVREIYSDSTGSNQFIEFFSSFSSQQFLNGQSVSTPNGSIPLSQLPGDSANRTFLLATALSTNFGCPKPDFIIPPGFLPLGSGSVTFSGSGATLGYSGLPNNGVASLNFPGSTSAQNSPQNFAGQVGAITINVNSPPFVSITNPLNNALFVAPGTVSVGVMATDNVSVASVELMTNGVIAGAADTVPPYAFTLSNLPAGSYTLRARALDNQSAASTSAPVNVRIASLPTLQVLRGTNGPLQFQFNSATGINYVVERAVPLTNFSPVVTNAGKGSPIQFAETNGSAGQGTYRVRLQ